MGSDLAKLYRELESEKQTPDVKKIRKNIKDKLNDKLRLHFLELLEIGGIIGYENLELELSKAAELVGKLKKMK
ncbi:MAG: hypothetical protein IPJ81_15780 [Chitinophagaceae bacterium]|nr:hypothetical protein [Chitinophagaceae bacterium]